MISLVALYLVVGFGIAVVTWLVFGPPESCGQFLAVVLGWPLMLTILLLGL